MAGAVASTYTSDMRILVTNDDGVYAEGIKFLRDALEKLGEVVVVAPLEEKSTTGHSLTIHKPLRIVPIAPGVFGVNGSPADCVYLGMREIFKAPDLVVSGINRGANLGQDVYYSGTVSGAREASIYGIPSMAVSLGVNFKKPNPSLHYETAAKVALEVARGIKWDAVPRHTLLNLNVPDVPMKKMRGVELTHQGFQHYAGKVLKRRDHRGKNYYWVGGEYKGFKKDLGSDCYALDAGFSSLTPMKLDCTDVEFLSQFSESLKDIKSSSPKRGKAK